MANEHKFRLIKVGAPWCGPCQAMAKAKTLEKFGEKHPEVRVEEYTLSDEDGEEGAKLSDAEKEANDLADEYDVEAIPTCIITDMDGNELARTDEATGLSGLLKLYAKAKEKAESGGAKKRRKPAAPDGELAEE